MYGFHLFPKIFNIDIWSCELNLLFYLGKTKKDRLCVNCKAFLTWVGDGVGGLLGGDKAHRKLTFKPLDFLEALNVQRPCSRLFFVSCRNKRPLDFRSPECLTSVLKVVCYLGKTFLDFYKPWTFDGRAQGCFFPKGKWFWIFTSPECLTGVPKVIFLENDWLPGCTP